MLTEGTTEYTTCHGLLTEASSKCSGSALFQIAANGVDLDKLVIGKPARNVDAYSGYMTIEKLAWCVSQAHERGWRKFDFLHLKRWKVEENVLLYRCRCDGL